MIRRAALDLTQFVRSRVEDAVLGSLATSVALQGALFVGGTLLARMLGPESRGVLAALILVPTVLERIAQFGMPLAVTARIAQEGVISLSLLRFISRIAVVQLILLYIITVITYVILPHQVIPVQWGLLAITSTLGPLLLIRDYSLSSLQGTGSFWKFNKPRIFYSIAYPGLIALCFLVGVKSLTVITIVIILSNAVLSGTAAISVIRSAKDIDSPKIGDGLISFGLRSSIGSFSIVESSRLDQIVLMLMMGPESLGLYVAAAAFTNIIRSANDSVGYVAYSRAASEANSAAAMVIAFKYFALSIGMTIVACLTMVVASSVLLVPLFGEAFSGATVFLPWIVLSFGVLGLRRVLTEGLRGCGRPGIGSLGEVVASSGFILAAMALVAPLGPRGIPIALLGAESVALITLLAVAKNHRPTALPTRVRMN